MELFEDFSEILIELKNLLNQKKYSVATAESCTGGLLGAVLTSIPGSSTYFQGSIVAYSNYQKINLLKINEETLKNYGAVSEECALEMAKNLKDLINSNIIISITGIAGPEGGTNEKPVGTVFSSIIINNSENIFRYQFSGNRNLIRLMTVRTVLDNLLTLLENE